MPRVHRDLSRSTSVITTDPQLRREERVRNHYRKQRFEDAVTLVSVWAVVLVPLAIFVLGCAYFAHLAIAHDWDTFQARLAPIAYVVAGYVISALHSKGLRQSS